MEGSNVRVTREDGVAMAALDGEIDLVNAADVAERLSTGIDGASAMIIDLQGVLFMDSQAIALLDRLSARLEGEGCPVVVVAPPQSVPRRVLEIVDLGIELFDRVDDARAAVASRVASTDGSITPSS